MHVIGVVDLTGGRAVHAIRGEREHYAPVRTIGGIPIDSGDACAVATAYRNLGIAELYVADLDAIRGGALQEGVVASLASLGMPLWLDAGVSSAQRARRILELGVARAVVGLETLASYRALETVCAAVGGNRVVFSVDLRDGRTIVGSDDVPAGEPADVVAARAVTAGVAAVIVLDLARVGSFRGPDFSVIVRVRDAAPEIMLVAGGGVRNLDDFARLSTCGCDGVLVASAVHDGRVSAADVADAHQLGRRPRL